MGDAKDVAMMRPEISMGVDAAPSRASWARKGVMVVLALLAVFAFSRVDVKLVLSDLLPVLQAWRKARPLVSAIVAFWTVVAWILTLLPLSPLELTVGFIFGAKVAYVIVFLGKVVGCTVAFLLGRSLCYSRAQRLLGGNELLKAVAKAVEKEPFKVCVVFRLAYVPISLKNFGLALVNVSPRDFVASLVCVELLNSFVLVAVGGAAKDFGALISGDATKSPLQLGFMALGLVCMLGLLLYISKLTRSAMNDMERERSD